MYTHKDRIKAVRLYLKLGKRLGVTIRQLGYPTKNTLIGWYREYLAKQDLRVGYSRSRGRYTDAQKHKAVEHYLDQGRCMAFTLRELGYPLARSAPSNTGKVWESRHKPVQVLRRTPGGQF